MATTPIVPQPRVETSTLSQYLSMQTEPIFRQDVFLAGLKEHGRISYNHGGKDIQWPVKFRRREITEAEGYYAGQDFPNTNVMRWATLPWRRLRLGESVTKFERLANRGKAALFSALGGLVDDLREDFVAEFREKLFSDGDSTGSLSIHGLESMFSDDDTTTGVLGDADDTYGLLSTELGYYGGSWTADTGLEYPTGKGNTEYNFYTPLIVDTTNTGWTATIKTWPSTWQECLRYAMAYQQVLYKNKYDFCLMNPVQWLAASQSLESTQRFEINQSSALTKLGFQALAFDGMDLVTQYGVPAATTYLLTWSKMSLRSMQSQLIDVTKDKDINDSSELIHLDCFCNMQFDSPAYHAKVYDITAANA